jgi:hypothetical protein
LVTVAGTELANVTLERNLKSLGTSQFPGFSSLVQSDSFAAIAAQTGMNRDASVSLRFVNGKHWSNAAWPA